MAEVEQLLRAELHRQATAPQPDPERLLHRIRRARRRAAARTNGILLVTIGLLVTTVWFGRSDDTPFADGPRIAAPHFIHFATPDHGFAILEGRWLARTTDGGRTWQHRPLPNLPGDQDAPRVWFHVLGPDTVVLDSMTGQFRWYSSDGGKTWTNPPAAPQGQIDHIPDGAYVRIQSRPGQPTELVVTTADGLTRTLATPPGPQFEPASMFAQMAADSSIWVQGHDGERHWLFASRDRGRTWEQVTVPEAGRSAYAATEDGTNLYFIDLDGHRAWLKPPNGDWVSLQVPAGPITSATLTMDGGLLFSDIPRGNLQTTVRRAGARWMRGTPPDSHTVDGRNWIELRF